MTSRHPGWIAGGILLLVCIWLLSGAFGSDDAHDEQTSTQTEAPKLRVRVVELSCVM